MDRDVAIEVLEAVGAIEKLLDDCPHGVAKKIKDKLVVCERAAHSAFPGDYAGECIYCEAPMGHDESVYVGEEHSCQKCYAERLEEIRTCEHTLEADTDEFGEECRSCRKCGYVEHPETV